MTPTPLPPDTLAAFGGDELRARIFYEKYALRGPDNQVLETTPSQMWERLATGLAAMEIDEHRRADAYKEFRWLLNGFRFIPGGRIMAAIGSDRKVTALNCYVLPSPHDSIEGIFATAAEAARTHAAGGGCGLDISSLRPKGTPVRNSARTSSGAVSFMELYSTETGMIGQSGRRGATMITIADSHPDVLDFCKVKRNRTSVRFANISIRFTDAFMTALDRDDLWPLHYENRERGLLVKKEIHAKELWRELVEGARDWAEPGCLFWSTVERRGTSQYNGMQVVSTNPCGEQSLEPYGACDLGSLNLLAFVKQPFADLSPEHNFDWPTLTRAIHAGVRFLDNVLTWNTDRHPLPAQAEAATKSRRIGLGVTALGDLFVALRLPYSSDASIAFTERLFAHIRDEAYTASCALAREKDPFPAFDRYTHLHQPFLLELPPTLQQQIAQHGLRNVALMTVPPVGTGAALAGVTSGIEPIFSISYLRRSETLTKEEFTVLHPLAARYRTEHSDAIPASLRDSDIAKYLPPYFNTAHDIDPMARVRMQATIGHFVDNAISSTINLPKDTTPETVDRIYRAAHTAGLKGVTVYRESSREGILLTPEEAAKRSQGTIAIRLTQTINQLAGALLPADTTLSATPTDAELERLEEAVTTALKARNGQLTLIPSLPALAPRPDIMDGKTIIQEAPEGKLAITIHNVNGEPFEILCHGGKAGSDILAAVQAMARAVSILLRLQRLPSQRERLEILIEQWRGIGGSRHVGFGSHKVRSAPDAIATALRRYLDIKAGVISTPDTPPTPNAPSLDLPLTSNGNCCPNCHRFSLITDEGCLRCHECGFKEC